MVHPMPCRDRREHLVKALEEDDERRESFLEFALRAHRDFLEELSAERARREAPLADLTGWAECEKAEAFGYGS